jgi:hypothetical protein
MRVRRIAFLPPAALVTGALFFLTSSIVSGLESTLVQQKVSDAIPIALYETECELLERRIEEVARDIQSCEALPGCLQSQNLCPEALQTQLSEEYDRLRWAVGERCAGVPTYVTRVSATCAEDSVDCSVGLCPESNESSPDPSSSPDPGIFLF